MTTRLNSDAAETFRNLKAAIEEFQSNRVLNLIGQAIKDIIYKRTKSGYGVTDDAQFGKSEKQKLQKLSKSYIAQREGKAFFFKKDGKLYKIDLPSKSFRPKIINTGEFFSARRSNLTYTGQLLDSIRVRVFSGKVSVDIPNSTRDDGKTNQEVAQYVAKARPFFNITAGELRIIDKLIRSELKKILISKGKISSSKLTGF